jgi:hypothetical protein
VDYLKPIRPRVNERLPTLRIERDALDVAATPLVDDRHAISFDLVRIEKRLIVLRAVDQHECEHVCVPDQQAQNALRLLVARKLRTSLALLLIPDPPQPFRGHDGIGRREHRADETVESIDIHRIFKTVRGMQKRVEFLDLPSGQWPGLDRPDWHVPFHREALSDHAAS